MIGHREVDCPLKSSSVSISKEKVSVANDSMNIVPKGSVDHPSLIPDLDMDSTARSSFSNLDLMKDFPLEPLYGPWVLVFRRRRNHRRSTEVAQFDSVHGSRWRQAGKLK
ncbi:hypothetical protein Cni_G07305 [Canna indica]|uniref:Uncharacterized protein n=1 Tax=Canna indica TaxID=4628 RepID=A0AAQ3K035_9LILI|nr:hypothetical protein Cni_G07305 [Canna indica]